MLALLLITHIYHMNMIDQSIPIVVLAVNVFRLKMTHLWSDFGKMPNVLKRELLGMLRAIVLLGVLVLVITLPRWMLQWRYGQKITAREAAPNQPVAIVFGAGLRRDGRPTVVLADRVTTAAELYHDGKVASLLMSGSADSFGFSEPAAMRDYALSLGIPQGAIQTDESGDRTYLTCLNARDRFNVDAALLVTQEFHLPRALILCDVLGIEAHGVSADLREYRAERFWSYRETAATLRALWDAGRTLLTAFVSSARTMCL
jgi:SanA protein